MQFFDPKLPDLFRNTASDEWTFTNDATGGDLRIMKFDNSRFNNLSNLEGFDNLPKFMQDKLKKTATYSLSEVAGADWNRIEFENQRLIDMFGSDVIYTPPNDKDALFYKSLEQWFDTLPYGSDEQGQPDGGDAFSLDQDSKSYGLTSSLLSIFGNE